MNRKKVITSDGRPLDEEDEWYIDAGLGDLLTIEEASDAVKEGCLLDSVCTIDSIFKQIIDDCEYPCASLKPVILNSGNAEPISRLTCKTIKKFLPKNVKYVIHAVAWHIGVSGAHWAAVVIDFSKGKPFITIYDSMQVPQNDRYISGFTKKFESYVAERFPDFPIEINGCNNCRRSIRIGTRQPTGGFTNPHLTTLYPESLSDDAYRALTSFRSQHHFCYMEAVLFIAEYVNGRQTCLIGKAKNQDNILNLMIIKRFIYGLVHLMDLFRGDCTVEEGYWNLRSVAKKKQLLRMKHFEKYFRYIYYAKFNPDFSGGQILDVINMSDKDTANLANIETVQDVVDYAYDIINR